MAAGIVAIVATLLTSVIGIGVLGWTPGQVLWAVVASNLASWCCLPVTLGGERIGWFKKYVIPDTIRTWLLLAGVYFGVLYALVPELRTLRTTLWLGLPVLFTTGFMIMAYGPLHDRLVRRAQLRARQRAKDKTAAAPG